MMISRNPKSTIPICPIDTYLGHGNFVWAAFSWKSQVRGHILCSSTWVTRGDRQASSSMIRLKAKQQEKKAEEQQQAADAAAAATAGDGESAAAEKPKTIKILGVGRGKRAGASKEKKRTPGEIRIQKGTTTTSSPLWSMRRSGARGGSR